MKYMRKRTCDMALWPFTVHSSQVSIIIRGIKHVQRKCTLVGKNFGTAY